MRTETVQTSLSIKDSGKPDAVVRAYDHPDSMRLLDAFYLEQVGRYGFADPVAADPAEYAAPQGLFLVVYHDDTPVGCGAYRWYDRPTRRVEIKRVYTCPDVRGLGIGRTVLTRLEQHAVANGAHRALLETGVRNDAAIRTFLAAGYRPIAPYVAGRNPNINRAFARSLVAEPEP